MSAREYFPICSFPSRCACCGANESTHFKHNPNCLLNIPGPHSDCSPFWYRGRNHGDLPANITTAQHESFKMGQKMSKVPFAAATLEVAVCL